MTCAAFCSQCGSPWLRLHSAPAACSSHAGSILATVRANSCEVSTSSAAITHGGGFRASPDDGWIMKPRLARADVDARLDVPHADLAEQPGQERAVDLLGRRPAASLGAKLELAHHADELRVDVLPLAHPVEREEVVAAELVAAGSCELRARASCQNAHSLR